MSVGFTTQIYPLIRLSCVPEMSSVVADVELSQERLDRINAQYSEISNFREVPGTCVDGRTSEEEPFWLTPQALGASLHSAILLAAQKDYSAIPVGEKLSFNEMRREAFARLQDSGFVVGVHGADHTHKDGESGCGLADNIVNIFTTFRDNSDETASMLSENQELFNISFEPNDPEWFEVVGMINNLLERIEYPLGEEIIDESVAQSGAAKQTLRGDHAEVMAVVNYDHGTTLNSNAANQNAEPVFNLDMWYVQEMARAMDLNMLSSVIEKLSLGLYIATEMVLVEKVHTDKRQPGIPLAVRRNDGIQLAKAA